MSHFNPESNSEIQKFYQSHHSWLKNLLIGKLGCPDDAADLAQDAFIRLIKKPVDFDNVAQERSYLSRIAHSLSVDFWRRKQIEKAYLESLEQMQWVPDIAEQHMIIDILQKADKMLSRLPDKIKRTFIASQIEGLTYKQIAQRDKVSVASVKNYLGQAIVRLALFKESYES